MKKKTFIMAHEGENLKVRYSVKKAGGVRVLLIDALDEYSEYDTIEIVVAKLGCYYISCPDMGTSCPAIKTLEDVNLIADLIHDAGYWEPETSAIAFTINELARDGF